MRTALTVRNTPVGPMLSPFFAKCQFVLFVDSVVNAAEWIRNYEGRAALIAAWIREGAVEHAICGHIDPATAAALAAAGIDVRVGPCTVPVEHLIASFDWLLRVDGAPTDGRD